MIPALIGERKTREWSRPRSGAPPGSSARVNSASGWWLRFSEPIPTVFFIINNGSDPNQAVIMPDLTHKNNFIAVAVWRPHKRLRETIDAFLALRSIRDSVLRIFGKMGKGMDDSVRRYAGDKVVFMDQVEDRARAAARVYAFGNGDDSFMLVRLLPKQRDRGDQPEMSGDLQ